MNAASTKRYISKSCVDKRHHHCVGFVFPLWNGLEWIPAPDTPFSTIVQYSKGRCGCKCHHNSEVELKAA